MFWPLGKSSYFQGAPHFIIIMWSNLNYFCLLLSCSRLRISLSELRQRIFSFLLGCFRWVRHAQFGTEGSCPGYALSGFRCLHLLQFEGTNFSTLASFHNLLFCLLCRKYSGKYYCQSCPIQHESYYKSLRVLSSLLSTLNFSTQAMSFQQVLCIDLNYSLKLHLRQGKFLWKCTWREKFPALAWRTWREWRHHHFRHFRLQRPPNKKLLHIPTAHLLNL